MTHEEYCIRSKVARDNDDLDFEMYDEEDEDDDGSNGDVDYSIGSSAIQSAESGLNQGSDGTPVAAMATSSQTPSQENITLDTNLNQDDNST